MEPEGPRGPAQATEVLPGIAGSPGVAIGSALVLGGGKVPFPRRRVARDEAPKERERFLAAVRRAQADVKAVAARLGGEEGEETVGAILET